MKSNERPPYFDNLVAFLADPADERTIKQFAEDNGIHPDTVHLFKRKHSEVLYKAVDSVRAQYKPQIKIAAYKRLFKQLNKTDFALKLAFQVVDELTEKQEVTTSFKSPEEKLQQAQELIKILSDRFNAGKQEKSE